MTRVPYLSARLQGFGTTIFAEMSALAVATDAVNLGQGFPDYPGPDEVLDLARAAIGTGHDQYPPGPGIPELRLAIAEHVQRFRGHAYDPDTEVLVTAGATEALAAALQPLLGPGGAAPEGAAPPRPPRGPGRRPAGFARAGRRGRAFRADVRQLRRGRGHGRG